jgi:hypothetical protein
LHADSLAYSAFANRVGLGIFDVVGRPLDESFVDRHIHHHATILDQDRVMVWYLQHGRHVSNGFPRLRTSQSPVLRWRGPASRLSLRDGLVVEHWAIVTTTPWSN